MSGSRPGGGRPAGRPDSRGSRGASLARVSRSFVRLSAVARRLEALLEPALRSTATFWLRAEISSGRERGGAFYCDLVETGPSGDIVAQMRCTIWARDLVRIRTRFREAGLDLDLRDGTEVGMLCRVGFHPRYGLALVGLDMDPTFALGELALRRRRILERLEREGLLGRNAERPVPLLPARVALVTSVGSAAFRDFVETLRRSPYGFRIYAADAQMQGDRTEAAVLEALAAAERLPVDLVVIARGGGSKTDLASLDNEAIARAVAAFPKPVWTAIGHETDESVLDVVAGRAFKTPTAAAEELVARFVAVDRQIEEARQRLSRVLRGQVRFRQERLRRAAIGLRQGSRKLLDLRRAELRHAATRLSGSVSARLGAHFAELGGAGRRLGTAAELRLRLARSGLDAAKAELERTGARSLRERRRALARLRERLRPEPALRRLEAERRTLGAREQTLRQAAPERALARGFSLSYDARGRLVRSAATVAPGERLTTQLVDGRIESEVRGVALEEEES